MKKIYFAFLLIFFLSLFFYLFYLQGTFPVNKKNGQEKIVVISPGEPLQKIIDKLAKEKLIRSKIVFYIIVKKMGIEKKIQAGDFRLSQKMNAYQIAENLTHGTLDIWVTLIEGIRIEEMAKILSKKFDIEEIEFIKKAEEGFMFPDTYLIPKNANVDTIIKILKTNYRKKVNEKIIKKAEEKGLNEKELITLASIVEKEAKTFKDKKIVASILLKRLKNNWPLQVDATIQYALGYQIKEKTWWKKYLTNEDLKIDSPYNTYKNRGLPPTPICNPGLESIQAVVEADPNIGYWYYISDKYGKNMHYATTLEEHEKNIEKYLN